MEILTAQDLFNTGRTNVMVNGVMVGYIEEKSGVVMARDMQGKGKPFGTIEAATNFLANRQSQQSTNQIGLL